MILGTVVGVVQTNVKRMLAYSSIAHAGYLLLGIVAANSAGKAADAVLPAGVRGHEPRRARASSRCSARRSSSTTSCATSPACGSRGRAWRG